jgi:two-component system, sensor histidine kinase and response regulator
MFEGNPLPMWVYDLETLQFLDVNRAAERTYGYTRNEFLKMKTTALQPPGYLERMRTMLANQALGDVDYLEWKHLHRDGTILDVEVSSHEVVREGRRARLVIVRDLSERRQLEKERIHAQSLAVALEKDRDLIRHKERFIAIASHEFRTPLAIIASGADIIRLYADRLSPQAVHDKAESIREQVRRLAQLLDDVLTLNRATSDELVTRAESLFIAPFLRSLFDHLRMEDRGRHIMSFASSLSEDQTWVTDRRIIEHIVVNLVSNAIKYSPEDSRIELRVSQQNDHLQIVVSDEGMGIPQEDYQRIFEPFFRLDSVGTIEGAGLGLAIVKHCIDAIQGEIHIESLVGEGTTFTAILPCMAVPDPAS